MVRRSIIAVFVATFLSIATTVTAAQFNWTNNSGGPFGVAANWTPVGVPPGVPGVNDEARFELNNTYTVTLAAAHTVNTLTQTRGDVTFDLNTNILRFTNLTNNTLGSAAGLTSTLRITDGLFRPGNLIVGATAGATSNLILDTTSNTTVGTGTLLVGQSGAGNLTLQNGAILTTQNGAGLGINAAGVGHAVVSALNTGATWTIETAPLRIGSSGTGTVDILSNGAVTAFGLEIGENLNSVGTLSVGGLASSFTTAGIANIGGSTPTAVATSATLNVAPGGTVTLNGTTNLRTNATMNLTGGTLNLNTVNVTNGAAVNWQSGTINFANGTAVTSNLLNTLLAGTNTLGPNRTLSATAGAMSLTSTLIVNGGRIAAPTINLNANMDISGFSNVLASATMTIQAGRTIQLGNFSTLGATTSTTNNGGTLVLTGPFANVNGLFVNAGGYVRGIGRFSGGLNNNAAGTLRLEAGDHLIIDQSSQKNAGTIELAGGTIEYSQDLDNQATGVITGRGVFRGSSANPGANGLNNRGVMAFSAGITDIFGDVNILATGKVIAGGGSVVTFYDDVINNGIEIRTNTGSRSVFFGDVTGAGPFTGGGDVELNGDLKPGNSPADVSFGGNLFISPTAGLEIELGGATKGSGYDALNVGGTLSLSGDLTVSLINNFIPQPGQSFNILTAAGGIDGTFDTELLPALGGGLSFDLQYNPTTVSLAVVGIPGDYNYDGTVDAADYVVWRKTVGASGNGLPADGNNSGAVDPTDYNIWTNNHNQQSPGTGGNADGSGAIPEPSAHILACAAMLAVLLNCPHAFRRP
jgi:T5SS/PEP-CTERM-associated repeat protein